MLETAQIERMSVVERLQAMEQIWDALCREGGEIASPEWHGEILAERQARAQRGDAKFLTMDELKTRLRGPQS